MLPNQKHVLQFLMVLFVVIGLVSGVAAVRETNEPVWWSLSSSVLVSAAGFYWYHLDSTRQGYARPVWLNVGVVAVAPLAIPLYVFKVTPHGARLRAMGRLLGYFLMLMGACMVGALIGAFSG